MLSSFKTEAMPTSYKVMLSFFAYLKNVASERCYDLLCFVAATAIGFIKDFRTMRYIACVFLGLIIITSWGSCASQLPTYSLEKLQGRWRRIASNNTEADSMLLQISGSSAVILYAPANSNFSNNELKWTGITPVVLPRDFTFSDKSIDGNFWAANIFVDLVENDSIKSFIVVSDAFAAAPGGEQKWVRE